MRGGQGQRSDVDGSCIPDAVTIAIIERARCIREAGVSTLTLEKLAPASEVQRLMTQAKAIDDWVKMRLWYCALAWAAS